MQRDRFVAVLLATAPESASLLKLGTGKIKAATDATAAEKAAITRWIGFKTGVKPASKVAVAAKSSAKKPTRKASKPAKGDTYTNSKGVLYRRVITYVPVN